MKTKKKQNNATTQKKTNTHTTKNVINITTNLKQN